MKKYLIIFSLFLLISISENISGQEQVTIMNATLPTTRSYLSCAHSSITDKVYCFGGRTGVNVFNQILEYDPLTDNLGIKNAILPSPRYGLSCAESNSKIYCFGGTDGASFSYQILEYDPQLDILIVESALLPTGRTDLSCAHSSSTNKIYCFGGYGIGGNPFISQILKYDPINNTIMSVGIVLPTPRSGLSCAESNNKIYCFGGLGGGSQIVEYDPIINVASIVNALPSARYYQSCSEISNKIYCFGGYTGTDLLNEITEYDAFYDVIAVRPVSLPSPRLGLSCSNNFADSKIYCFGGQVSSSSSIHTEQIVRYSSPNSPPLLNFIGNQQITENQTLIIQLQATDPENNTLTFNTNADSVLSSPFTFTQISNNEAIFEWTPTFFDSGDYNVTFTVTDDLGASDNEIILITVNNVNLPPVMSPIGNQQIIENQQLTIQLNAFDFDNDTLTFGTDAAFVLPSSFTFNQNTGLFEWIPSFTDYGDYTINFNVTDGLLSDEETITISVQDAQTANLFYIGTPVAGNTINFILGDSAAPSQIYILVLALGNDQPILLSDGRTIPLNADGGFFLSLGMPTIIGLSNSVGFLNSLGNTIATWTIPVYIPSGLTIKAAYVSINPTMTIPQGIISISNPVTLVTA